MFDLVDLQSFYLGIGVVVVWAFFEDIHTYGLLPDEFVPKILKLAILEGEYTSKIMMKLSTR